MKVYYGVEEFDKVANELSFKAETLALLINLVIAKEFSEF